MRTLFKRILIFCGSFHDFTGIGCSSNVLRFDPVVSVIYIFCAHKGIFSDVIIYIAQKNLLNLVKFPILSLLDLQTSQLLAITYLLCKILKASLLRGGFHVTSATPCWWTKTKDLLLDSFVRPPATVHCSIVIYVSVDSLQTVYIRLTHDFQGAETAMYFFQYSVLYSLLTS